MSEKIDMLKEMDSFACRAIVTALSSLPLDEMGAMCDRHHAAGLKEWDICLTVDGVEVPIADRYHPLFVAALIECPDYVTVNYTYDVETVTWTAPGVPPGVR